MTRMPFLTSPVMIIITQYGYKRKGGRIKILSYEDSCCPICGGRLKVHGTCNRKAWTPADNSDNSDIVQVEYSLRILECTQCGKTHRELPNELVPYKRYSLSLICEEVEEQNYTCDTSTMLRLKLWLNWFICYA